VGRFGTKKMGLFLAIVNGFCLQRAAVFIASTPSEPQVKKPVALEELCVEGMSPACPKSVFTRKTITQVFGKL